MAEAKIRAAYPRRVGLLSLLLLGALQNGCGLSSDRDGPPSTPMDMSRVPDAVPRYEPPSRYGNPPSYVVNGRRYHTLKTSHDYIERGVASWYGRKFHGRRTASGEVYDMYTMTAAHRSLPLPTYARVTNLNNGRKILVRINDRGPFHGNRIIDLSYAAASKLGMLGTGTALVEVKAVNSLRTVPKQLEASDSDSEVMPVALGSTETDRTGFYLQIGAFSLRANAERLQARLGAVAESVARISEMSLNGKTVFRVQLGPLMNLEQADRLAMLLAGEGFNPHITLE